MKITYDTILANEKTTLPSKKNMPYSSELIEEDFDKTNPCTGALLEAERNAFKKEIKDQTSYLGYSDTQGELMLDILDSPAVTIENHKDELREILQSAQSELKTIIEFKGRVVAICEKVAEITIYEEGKNVTYTNLDSDYLKDAGLSQGDPFILMVVNDNGVELPIFKIDKEIINRKNIEIGPKSKKTRLRALEAQNDLDKLYKFIKPDVTKQ